MAVVTALAPKNGGAFRLDFPQKTCPFGPWCVTLAAMRGIWLTLWGSLLLLGCGDDLRQNSSDACPTPPLDTSSARVFAVQPRIGPEQFVTYEAYQNHLINLVRTEASDCLSKDRPNVLVFPENTGLPAAFIGSRGQAARESSSAFAAFLALGGQYAKSVEFYKAQWPNVPLPNQIELAVTDTIWRAFHETNEVIATQFGAWVVSSVNVSGNVEKSTNAAEIAALADPDLPSSSYVYVARDPAIYNTTFVLDPNGTLVDSRKKPYLVDSEKNDLALTAGPLQEAKPVDIGPLNLGIFTSKDAWMPDMVDRLAIRGADTFVQAEAFSGWTIPESPAEPNVWAPDILSQSAMAAVRKHSVYRNGVVSHLTGNFFDQTFDGQSILVGDPIPGEVKPAYVGQADDGGVWAVAPWVTSDPIERDPAATLESRRSTLRATGQELLPGGTKANQYIETAIGADLGTTLPVVASGKPGVLGTSRALSDVGQAEQSHPSVAWSSTSALVVAFQEGSRDATRIMVATSDDQGKTFGTPHSVVTTSNAQATPAVAVSGAYVYVAWQERNQQQARIGCAMSSDRGKTFGAPVFVWTENAVPDTWLPAFATANGQIFLAYVDGSSGNERIAVAKTTEGSLVFATQHIEMSKPQALGDVRNNQWSPSIAASGNEVAVGWVDFRNANWDVYLARSIDGGATYSIPLRLDDGTDAPERLHNDTQLMFLPNVDPLTLAVGWSDVRERKRYASTRLSLVAGSVIGQSRMFGSATGSAVHPHLAPLGPSKVALVWQDDRTLGNDVYLTTSTDGGATFGTEQRLDDGGDGASYQTAPVAAGDGLGGLFVAWEDSRTGTRRIRFVLGKP